jgi:hypothetical protein
MGCSSLTNQKVIGYTTLVWGQIDTGTAPGFGADITYTYDDCPAVKIAWPQLPALLRSCKRGNDKAQPTS